MLQYIDLTKKKKKNHYSYTLLRSSFVKLHFTRNNANATLMIKLCPEFQNGVLCAKPKMTPSHIMLRYVDAGDSELI